MDRPNTDIKDAIIESALPDVVFDGWTAAMLEGAAIRAGYSGAMVRAVFPEGVSDAIAHFSDWANRQMMERLGQVDAQSMRVRDRVALAVRTRLDVLAPHKDAEAKAIGYWMQPFRKWIAARLIWRTADMIWEWAGDQSTDYNRYTKRTLLCGVLTSTTLYWLNDKSDGHADTHAFLERRIDNVMTVGRIVGKRKKA